MIKRLGEYHTQDGEHYDCIFYPKKKIAKAIGPLPKFGIGSRGPKVEVTAESEEEARRKLSERLGPGNYPGKVKKT